MTGGLAVDSTPGKPTSNTAAPPKKPQGVPGSKPAAGTAAPARDEATQVFSDTVTAAAAGQKTAAPAARAASQPSKPASPGKEPAAAKQAAGRI